MNESRLRAALAQLPIPEIRYFESAGSTNDLAMQWLESGASDGALVAADMQTAGRGRMARRWVTNPGCALAFSLILHPRSGEVDKLPFFAPLAGLAVSKALERLGLEAEIKWPNDVLVERKKVCGILVEASWSGDHPQGMVIGIGVNVAPCSMPPASELLFPAGCVEQALGRPVDRVELLAHILAHLFDLRPTLASAEFMQDWEQRLAFRGEMVQVEPPGQPALVGMLAGIDGEGNLVLRLKQGLEVKIPAGDVARLRPMV